MTLARTQCMARLVFILSVVFVFVYFLLPPSPEERLRIEQALREKKIKKFLHNERFAQHDMMVSDRRQREEQEAINITKKIIKERLRFHFHDSIPGSSIRYDVMRLNRFRRQLECMTSRGSWVLDHTPRSIIQHKQDPLYGKCDRPFSISNNSTMEEKWNYARESIKYVWKTPAECPMPKFNVKQACSIFSGKWFLLVGDTLHFQLHELLLDYFSDESVQCYGEISCREHVLCKVDPNDPAHNAKVSKMRFTRNDIISLTMNAKYAGGNVELPWTAHAHHFNVLIMNRGHHWQDDVTFRRGLINVMNYLRKKFSNTLIIYKATTLGHLNCQTAERPLSSRPNATEMESLPYHWSEIHRQNLIAREIVETAGGVFLDLESVMMTRVDDHIGGRDCLRWCIPGPTDVWLDFLFHIMKELR
ncbi:4354_t:CDS:1 [Acaulospora morrowiae]|uniref:4354_t:CDS:1 n=1 Tax=Acaulospora morrowiae TaxID=94023 RepID=A0A9N9B754_9GLOM|nr:4354_t:CDS:1 [Acaulospora morrowiae]